MLRVSFLILVYVLAKPTAYCQIVHDTSSHKIAPLQNIKGKVVDKQTQYPLTGATVVVTSLPHPKGTITDIDGDFKIEKLPIGRHTLKISYLGYFERTIPNILLNSGKEFSVTVELEEQVNQADEVVVVAEKDKSKPNNEMALISSRSFTIEESNRYSGSLNDPSRMAMNFAGVGSGSDTRNDIIIRGNSPLGLLWRLEGIDIPSPNHFGAYGTTGGPISMLNNNVLANSDFMTSAFPANYGNAISGVFDLKMRKGNIDKREYLAQIGFNGLELGIEGPFSKKSKASFLANYRYSTLGIFKAIGISFGTSALPQYQDLNFKIDIPINTKHKISVFGLGGYSTVKVDGNITDSTDLYSDRGYNQAFQTGMGVIGSGHTYFINPNTSLKTNIAASFSSAIGSEDSIPRDLNGKFIGSPLPRFRNTFQQYRYSFQQSFNKKISAKNVINIGYYADLFRFSLVDSLLFFKTTFISLRNFEGTSSLIRSYAQWQHRFNDNITFTAGIQHQHFAFNSSQALEPRVGIKYQIHPSHAINLGYGLHSQLQPFPAYFKETEPQNGISLKSNKNLGFVRSHQWVIGYDYSISKNMRAKVETYYQSIFNAAVESKKSSFSMLNAGADFGIPSPDSLTNKGTGRNYGIEFTLERFFYKNYYFLITNSLFNSYYTASDDVERNSAFNNKHILNVLAGKEFKISEKFSISLDFKITWAGGRRYTPIDLEQSIDLGREVRINDKAFDAQFQDYFRPDVKLSFRINSKKITQEIYFDVQNVINRKNPFTEKYSPDKKKIIIVNQLGIFPVLQYRLTF